MNILNEVLTAAEAAELYKLDTTTIKKACQQGRLICRKAKGTWLVTRKEMEEKYGDKTLH
jgi:DNA-directed RNA polymerase specialized sigma24 family protein